jgi:hypothetical protein
MSRVEWSRKSSFEYCCIVDVGAALGNRAGFGQ